MGGNNLTSLPEEIAQLRRLKTLFFANNEFQSIPTVLGKLPELFMLSFKGTTPTSPISIENPLSFFNLPLLCTSFFVFVRACVPMYTPVSDLYFVQCSTYVRTCSLTCLSIYPFIDMSTHQFINLYIITYIYQSDRSIIAIITTTTVIISF